MTIFSKAVNRFSAYLSKSQWSFIEEVGKSILNLQETLTGQNVEKEQIVRFTFSYSKTYTSYI